MGCPGATFAGRIGVPWLRAVSVKWPLIPVVALALGGCSKAESEPSSLAKRAGKPEAPTPAESESKAKAKDKAPTDAKAALADKLQLGDAPPDDAERVSLYLALDEPTTYEMTSIGMVKFSMVQAPVGFARRERVTLDNCQGEGATRSCKASHRYFNFESELPILQEDEARVSELTTAHTLGANGIRTGTTAVDGPEAALESDAGKALADVHRFYCLRFPDEPVAVGAKWKDDCVTRSGGQPTKRQVMWELSKLDDDPGGLGKRAELSVVGKVTRPDAKGVPREGTLQGRLLFLVDRHQPFRYQERIVVKTDDAGKMESRTDVATQFALVTPGKPEKIVLTNGQTPDEAKAAAEAARAAAAGSQEQGGAAPTPAPPAG